MTTYYRIICAACRHYLGRATTTTADNLYTRHQPRCTATPEQHEQAITDMQFAHITGDTTALHADDR